MLPFTCFSTIGCPEKSLPEVLALADQHGVPYVEIRTLQGREDLPALFTETFGTPKAVEECFSQYKAKPLVWGSSFSLLGSETFEGLDTLLPWLAPYPWIRVFDGGKLGQKLTDEDIARCRRCLEWARAQLETHGVSTQVLIETHYALTDPVECRRLVDALGGEIRLLWDSNHTWRHGHSSMQATWELLGPWVRHIHIKDSIADASGVHYTLPGQGEFDFAELARLLKESDYQGEVSMEWEKRWQPHLAPLEEVFAVYQ